jgi:hypothetical protein
MENRAEADRSVGIRNGGGVELEPEAVLPSQFFSRIQIDASLQPEKRLMLAVLEDAVGTFQKYVGSRERAAQRLFSDVEEWFGSDDQEWPFSFGNICNALDLDVAYMRRGLRTWQERQQTAIRIDGSKVVRFPFRRVNGSRHAITGRAAGLRRSA